MAPCVRAWSIATINALPSEASSGKFLKFTPEVEVSTPPLAACQQVSTLKPAAFARQHFSFRVDTSWLTC